MQQKFGTIGIGLLTLGVGLTVYGFIGGATKTRFAGPILVAISIFVIFCSCRGTFFRSTLVTETASVPPAVIHSYDNAGRDSGERRGRDVPPPNYPPPSYPAMEYTCSPMRRSKYFLQSFLTTLSDKT